MASVKRIAKMAISGPAFVTLAASTAGAALAPSWGQPAVVGAFVGGLVVLLIITAI